MTVRHPPLPVELSIALKEWAVVVDAMERGEQTLLLRKGGLADREAAFEAAHAAFLLYPTTENQRPEAVKQRYRERIAPPPLSPTRSASRYASRAPPSRPTPAPSRIVAPSMR